MSLHRMVPIYGCAFLLSVMLTSAAAQDDVTREELEWESSGGLTTRIEENRRIMELERDVRIRQGGLVITGDSAVLEYNLDTEEFDRVSVFGTPVRYQQQLGGEQGQVDGEGDQIVLLTDPATAETVVELTGNAKIRSPDSAMNCAAITYLTERALIREALGPCTGSLSQQNDGSSQ